MGSIAYALAAGNAVVFKPSELTPGVGEWLVDSFAEAVGEDAGLLQVVTGEGETGAALCRAGVDKIAFTGSTATAKKVMATCAETLTPVLVECGGKDALLVDADADLDAAADAVVWGAMSNAGQTCVGVERVYVVDAVAEDLLDQVAAQAADHRARRGDDAQLRPDHHALAARHHPAPHRRRARPRRAGRGRRARRPCARPTSSPSVLADVPEDCSAVTDETFGPTVVVNRVARHRRGRRARQRLALRPRRLGVRQGPRPRGRPPPARRHGVGELRSSPSPASRRCPSAASATPASAASTASTGCASSPGRWRSPSAASAASTS